MQNKTRSKHLKTMGAWSVPAFSCLPMIVFTTCALQMPPDHCRASTEVPKSLSWTIRFPLLETPCADASVKLRLRDTQGKTLSEFSPQLIDTSVWDVEVRSAGRYSIHPVVTDCDGKERELPGIPARVSPHEVGRAISLIARENQGHFELLAAQACAVVDGSGTVTAYDRGLLFSNSLNRDLSACSSRAVVLKAVEEETVKELTRMEWPEDRQVLSAGDVLEIELDPTRLQSGPRQNRPRIVLELWIDPLERDSVDYGWDSLPSKPFVYEACCEVIQVDVTSMLDVRQAERGRDCRPESMGCKVEETTLLIRSSAAAIHRWREKSGEFPPTFGRLISSARISELLGEKYSGANHHDAWGNPLAYWSNGVYMLLASPGCDGRLDIDYERLSNTLELDYEGVVERLCIGPATENDDVMFFEDNLCSWPKHEGCPGK